MGEIGEPATEAAGPPHRRIALGVACAAIAALLYLPSLGFEFVNWDDDFHVYRNPVVTGDAPTTTRDALLTPQLGYPAPTTLATYRVEHAIYGLSPAGYHATNIALHAISTGLVFALALALGLRARAAVVAALLFAVHPVAAEPVSWISGRKDLLATCLALASVLAHLKRPLSPNKARSYGALVLFTLAVFSKPSVALVPIFALAADRVVRGRPWPRALASVAPMAIVSVIAVALGAYGQTRVGALADALGPASWLRNMWFALGHHAGLVFLTHEPLPKYVLAHMPPSLSPATDLLPLVLFALVALSLLLSGPRRKTVALCWLLATVAYLPNSNAVPLVRFLADSYVYLPLTGLALVAAACIDRVADRWPQRRWIPLAVAAFATVALAPRALTASATWRDGTTLWSTVYAAYPRSPEVCRNLGNAYAERNQLREALAQYLQCADKFDRKLVAKNVGIVLMRMGRKDQARAILREAANDHPDDAAIQRYLRELEGEAP